MPIPLLEISPKTQNQRVAGYDVPDEDDPLMYRMTDITTVAGIDELIWAAYRQIFSEHLILDSYRQSALESQLRNRAISVREFIRGLGKTDVYRNLIGETNSNYRLVDLTFKRFLGRASYGMDEQIAQSIVIATRGLHGFIDTIVDSEEYLSNFGSDMVPYQRRRMEGRPFNLVNPRYGSDWRDRLMMAGLQGRSYYQARKYQAGDLDRSIVRQGIPSLFLSMAQGLSTPQLDSQRDVARATSSAIKIPDMTRDSAGKPTVKRVEVALPYRYISSDPRV
jgi:phycobilisome rod-core linker protein